MNKTIKIAIPVVAGLLAVSTGIGWAAARNSAPGTVNRPAVSYETVGNGTTQDEGDHPGYCGEFGGMMGYGAGFPAAPQVAALLGTTAAELQSKLDSGQTLADIAAAKGVSQDRLIETMMGPYSDHLAIMVKYSYLTQAQADSLAQQARERLQAVITQPVDSGDNDMGDYMDRMMDGYGGGMMGSWGGQWQSPGNDTNSRPGYGGGMMGGSGSGMMGW